MARMSEKELREVAKQLLKDPTDLCNRVMQKWLVAVLEEMQDRLNAPKPLSASPGCYTEYRVFEGPAGGTLFVESHPTSDAAIGRCQELLAMSPHSTFRLIKCDYEIVSQTPLAVFEKEQP